MTLGRVCLHTSNHHTLYSKDHESHATIQWCCLDLFFYEKEAKHFFDNILVFQSRQRTFVSTLVEPHDGLLIS
jgi:hypothetical protein